MFLYNGPAYFKTVTEAEILEGAKMLQCENGNAREKIPI